jgi:hypothetical protein
MALLASLLVVQSLALPLNTVTAVQTAASEYHNRGALSALPVAVAQQAKQPEQATLATQAAELEDARPPAVPQPQPVNEYQDDDNFYVVFADDVVTGEPGTSCL